MRRFLRVLPVLLLALACTKSTISPGLRLDFVGASRFTSSTRALSTTPADTLATKIYAINTDTTVKLQRLRIVLSSQATRTPVVYPTSGIFSPPPTDAPLVYLDSVLAPGPTDLAFTNLLAGRTTSGVDLWEYTATDVNNNTATRAYRLALRRPDSTAVLQTYRLYLSPVPNNGTALTAAQNRAFAYVGLREGLVLPHLAVAAQPAANHAETAANQPLIDLVCIATGTDVRLATTRSTSVKNFSFSAQTTALRSTTLGLADFPGLTTSFLVQGAFTNGTAYPPNGAFDAAVTAPLVKGTTIAFRITDSGGIPRSGAIFIADLVRTPTVIVTCQVVVEK
ncbi:hypothetical protein ACFQ48_05045 [Hymenobacter caeli]|uniref:DUF4397 domain-containing protein n=1 Tax=Hymenobacter caeli TaxID=2735894 RepID=A0ABX2FR71_9BACT|nr:hypothetical protein [Hymenobacter caeli]NRT19323.1 hypothetical protein [Hymenobacter caeli]